MKANKFLTGLFLAGMILTSCKKDETVPVKATFDGGDVSGVWTKNGTYTVEGHMIIPEGQSLTIEEGVTVIMADTSLKTEIIVSGNLYCKGTEANPITFTVPEELRTSANAMTGLWGGILVDATAGEILFDHTIMEYAGATTTEASPSVQRLLYKGEAGEGLPLMWTGNTNSKIVIANSIFRNLAEDIFYFEGGSIILYNNILHTSGNSGGEAINVKSGCVVDAAYNLIFSPNTNGFKLSNSDDRTPQANVAAYNNTIVNAGWRRPSVKGGSVWLEELVNARIFNNLIVNCRFGVKDNGADERSVWDYNYFYGYNQTCVDQFQEGEPKVVVGEHDVKGTTAGENDPMFVNYPLNNDMFSYTFDYSWDFHLKSGSPAVGKGTTSLDQNFPSGISINGKTYAAPAPSTTIGAFGVN